jgi:hypothetical protein
MAGARSENTLISEDVGRSLISFFSIKNILKLKSFFAEYQKSKNKRVYIKSAHIVQKGEYWI